MRADRLLSIVWLLQSRGRMTASELADRLEVTSRTILRDVESLSAAGVPVVTHRGRDGGLELLQGFRPVVTALTPHESQALFAGISGAAAESLGLGHAFASAVRKMLAAVPEPSRPAAVALADRVLVDPDGWLPPRIVPVLTHALDAVLRGRRAQMTYTSRGKAPDERVVDPYGLVSSAGTWYLVASHDGATKFFRLTRVSGLTVLDEDADVPDHLDLDTLWRAHRARFLDGFDVCEVRLLVRPDLLIELREQAVTCSEPTRTEAVDDSPWPAVVAAFGDLRHARNVLLVMGDAAVVLGPPSVQEALRSHAEGVLRRCAASPPESAPESAPESLSASPPAHHEPT